MIFAQWRRQLLPLPGSATIEKADAFKYMNAQMYGNTSLTKEHHKIWDKEITK